MGRNTLSPADLRERMTNGPQPILVDVRTPAEFARIHAPSAHSMPLGSLNVAAIEQFRNPDGRIYLICQSGTRASMACRQLESSGIRDLWLVEGGMAGWIAAGLPTVTTRSGGISLERQVRIGAGSLVLLGCLLAWLITPSFILLSAFVGAGLVFAGITDICGMAILLGKLPWNRAPRPQE